MRWRRPVMVLLAPAGGGYSVSIILGIDPGSRITGYGVIRGGRTTDLSTGGGCIRTKIDDLPSRLKLSYTQA